MFFRFRIAMGLALLLVIGFAMPVLAGGWAVITLDELPLDVVAGKPLTLGFTVLQHGIAPMAGLEPTVTARLSSDEKMTIYAEPEGKPGHYAATITFPKEGEWEWSIQAFTMDQPMPMLSVAAPSAASASQPMKTDPATPSISALLIVRTLALGIGLIGLVVAFRRRSRLAVALTVFCLLFGIGSFILGAATGSAMSAVERSSVEAIKNSSLSQVEFGRQLFVAKGCVTCHTNTKIPRTMIGSFTVPIGTNLSNFSANPEVLFMRLKDPASVKSDTQMPNLNLSEAEIEALIAFINSE
ncbi:MAG TPA: c-type cytochrome [Anaerolineales bacterium]